MVMVDINISQLVLNIKEANEKYRIGNPIMSDTEYDNMVDKLKLCVDETTFESFRKTLTEESGKIEHPYIMGSLDKIKAFDDSASPYKWVQKIFEHKPNDWSLFISSKIDGCSARISYFNGELVGASTRGDGEYGVNILNKAVLFIPTKLKTKFTGEIRGEITLTTQTMESLSDLNGKSYKNLRNATAGLLNSKESSDEEISFLRFFPYEIMGETMLSKSEQFKKLKNLGFETALHRVLIDTYEIVNGINPSDLDNKLLDIFNSFCEIAPYDIDGLVVSDNTESNIFENCFIPKKTVAVKFNQMTAESTLIDIIWNVSKGGRLSPVGIIEAVNIGGSTVSNVTLNNIRIMEEMGITYGCTVSVLKSGDVIPKIVGVRHDNIEKEVKIDYPTICPSCGKNLVYEDKCLYPKCVNPKCDDIVHNKILHFLKQLGIKHVSLKTIAKFGLTEINDLINLKNEGGAVQKTFYKNLDKMMFGASKIKLLKAFDYDGISSQIIDKMIQHYGYESVINPDYEQFVKNLPYGVGEKFLNKFINGFHKIKEDFFNILSNERYHGDSSGNADTTAVVINGVLGGNGFVVTGNLETMSRDNFKDCVIMNGGIYQTSVSKKTKYLVCNNRDTATSKIKKATSLGVSVINEQEFLNMVRDGSDGFSIF